MIEVYDQARKIFITPSPVPDMDCVPTYDKSDDETGDEQRDTIDMSDLESEGLKILIPQQMLNRLPISLAQLKAGNKSEKLKNEIRQLLYSLQRSKKLSKTIYKHLMNAII